jgi:hypothetical protein
LASRAFAIFGGLSNGSGSNLDVEFRACLEHAHDMATRDDSGQISMLNDRHLIYILPAHHFQCLSYWSFRTYASQSLERTHYVANRGVRPTRAINRLDFVRRDDPGRPSLFEHHETAMTGWQ